MIITTRRSRLRYLLDIVVTAFGWVMFVYLFGAGILNILQGRAQGPDAPFLPQELRDSLGTLAGYTVLMLVFAAIFILWFQYNEHFGKYAKYGRYRRQQIPAVSDEQLSQNLGVTPVQFDTAQSARVLVVHHDNNGAIIRLEDDAPNYLDASFSRNFSTT